MSVRAVQNDNNQGRMSYLNSGLFGALAAYSLKYIIPIMPQEKDEFFYAELNEIKQKAKALKTSKIDEIRNTKNKTPAMEQFIYLHDKGKLKSSKIRSQSESLRKGLSEILFNINNSARNLIQREKVMLITKTKEIRPASTFIIIGTLAGTAIAGINNIINTIAQDKAHRLNKEDTDCIDCNNCDD